MCYNYYAKTSILDVSRILKIMITFNDINDTIVHSHHCS